MGTKRDRRERGQNYVPAEHRYVEGGISMMDLERIYIYIYNKLPNFNKPTLLGGGREYGERSLIYPKMRFETCSSPYLIYLSNLNSFGKNISYYYSLSLEP